jgi:hypothetical protein
VPWTTPLRQSKTPSTSSISGATHGWCASVSSFDRGAVRKTRLPCHRRSRSARRPPSRETCRPNVRHGAGRASPRIRPASGHGRMARASVSGSSQGRRAGLTWERNSIAQVETGQGRPAIPEAPCSGPGQLAERPGPRPPW